MRLVKINDSLYTKYILADREVLQKTTRPYALVLKLEYKNTIYDFAIPLRSNINASSPRIDFFPLPTRSTTLDGRRHGLHIIKMVPMSKEFSIAYLADNDWDRSIKSYIFAHRNEIIDKIKTYLKNYENGIIPKYSTNLDTLLTVLEEEKRKISSSHTNL